MAKHTARKVRPVDTDDTKKEGVMQDAKKARSCSPRVRAAPSRR